MLQIVDGREVFVVEFDTLPELPITWSTPEEKPYAQILEAAIQNRGITKPGKYGLALEDELPGVALTYSVYIINE